MLSAEIKEAMSCQIFWSWYITQLTACSRLQVQDLSYLVKSMEGTLFGKRFQSLTQGLCEVCAPSALLASLACHSLPIYQVQAGGGHSKAFNAVCLCNGWVPLMESRLGQDGQGRVIHTPHLV